MNKRGRKEKGTGAEEEGATSGEDQIAQAHLCFILPTLWPARELGGETQFRRRVSWLGGYQAFNHLLRVVEVQKIKCKDTQVSICSFIKSGDYLLPCIPKNLIIVA